MCGCVCVCVAVMFIEYKYIYVTTKDFLIPTELHGKETVRILIYFSRALHCLWLLAATVWIFNSSCRCNWSGPVCCLVCRECDSRSHVGIAIHGRMSGLRFTVACRDCDSRSHSAVPSAAMSAVPLAAISIYIRTCAATLTLYCCALPWRKFVESCTNLRHHAFSMHNSNIFYFWFFVFNLYGIMQVLFPYGTSDCIDTSDTFPGRSE